MAGAPPCRATHARPCRWGGQTAPECRGRRLAEQRMRDHVAGGADGAGMSGAPPLRSRVWPCRARSSLAPACRVAPQRQSFRIPEAPPLGGAGRAAGTARPANAFPAAHPAGGSGGGRGPRRRQGAAAAASGRIQPRGRAQGAARKRDRIRRGRSVRARCPQKPAAPRPLCRSPAARGPFPSGAGRWPEGQDVMQEPPCARPFSLPFSSRRPEQVRAAPRGCRARPFSLPFSFLDAGAGAGAAARAAPRARPRLRETRRGSSGEA